MATYRETQSYVRERHGYTPKTCWIAHVKELSGLPVRRAHNRRGEQRRILCPPEKQHDILDAFEHFGMVERLTQYETRLIKETESQLSSLECYSPYEMEAFLSDVVELHRIAPAAPPDAVLREAPIVYKGWSLAPTPEFQKTVMRMDKKIKGRVLEAINVLSTRPKQLHGDTVKPLSGELRGRWRYRIGDFRLIYWPDEERRTVFLLAVLPRGAAYAQS